MNTFLPYPDFDLSARCLDRLRLGKQRVECMQIADCLIRGKGRWLNHPAVRMWRGHGHYLCVYWQAIVNEWNRRKYFDTTIHTLREFDPIFMCRQENDPPPWLGDPRVHNSHQSQLFKKDPVHYVTFNDVGDLPYYWPVD